MNMINNVKCKYQKLCGSCQLLDKSYQDTLNFKLTYVNDCLHKAGFNHQVTKIVEAKQNTNYRNKMIIGYKFVNGKIISGFYEENTHHIIDIDECQMHSKMQNFILQNLKSIFQSLKIKPYDEDRKVGLIRYVLVREAYFTGEILIVLVTASEIFPARSEVVKRIKALSPKIKTIIQNINSRKTSIVLGDKERILYGNGYITDLFGNLKFNISSKAFYQINTLQTQNLYEKIKLLANFNKNETIIDAYSGVGTIGLILASSVKEVISIENNQQSVRAAILNAKINQIKNVHFICDDATNYLVEIAKEKVKIDAIIMDPPRTGSTIAFLEAIKKIKPRKVIYVSCDPSTLARDLKVLKNEYKIMESVCVDMFSWTNHVETLVVLSHKKSDGHI